ncbi:MAG: hypothetical protein ACE5HP_12240 [Gemmatimonadota bacterium]
MYDDEEQKPGPKPRRLKLPHDDWEEAVREALEKERPEACESQEEEEEEEEKGASEDQERT